MSDDTTLDGTTLTADVFAELVAALDDRDVDPDIGALDAFRALEVLLTLRNMTDHAAAVLVGHLDRLGVATTRGRTLRELLTCMGCAPAVASRLIRLGTAIDVDALRQSTADGVISSEHADAIVRGLTHIATRSGEPVSSDLRHEHTSRLLSHALAGMAPADITSYARQLGNDLAADTDGGLPAAEDHSINSLTWGKTTDGRLAFHGDVDVVVGEKLSTAIDALSTPTPQPDGSPDPRTTERRHADALETLIDAAARGVTDGTMSTTPRYDVLVMLDGTDPQRSWMPFMGPITAHTATTLSCDPNITVAITNGDDVPLAVGRRQRLFTPTQRKALLLRDKGCIKCGAPAAHTQAHHIKHWADGGDTDLDNGCLACTSCHHDIHDRGWDVIMGADHHPWLIPPTSVDPHRRPQPAYHRRTLRLDTAA